MAVFFCCADMIYIYIHTQYQSMSYKTETKTLTFYFAFQVLISPITVLPEIDEALMSQVTLIHT